MPVDRSKQMLTDGSPVPADQSHTEDRGDGQQRGYVVLTDDERAKGFVRPVRRSYKHVGASGCQAVTTMGLSIAETYARDPAFYGATFCATCGAHFPLAQFVWNGSNETVGT